MKTILVFLLLINLSSCGKKESTKQPQLEAVRPPNVRVPIDEQKEEEEVEIENEKPEFIGPYISKFHATNPTVSDLVTGALTVSKDSDEIIFDIRFNSGDLTSSVFHKQTIRSGTRCPNEADDLNKDGFIDANEGAIVYGKTLIPLDADLNAQHLGLGTWPVSNEFGGYIYTQVASYSKFLADLFEVDINHDDNIIKQPSTEVFQLIGKVILIQGVSPEASLPETVQSESRMDTYESFPIACGVITSVESVPGMIDNDLPLTTTEDPPGGPAGMDDGTFLKPPTT